MTELSSPTAHPGANAGPADLDAQSPTWYLAYTKPQQEAVAADQLARQGYGVYLPLYKTWPKAGGKRAAAGSAGAAPSAVFEPMFPRYVFFRPSCASQSLSPARSTRGVSTLVSFGLGPAPVNPLLIDTIRSLEAQRNQADAQALTPFQPGAAVLLNADPFRGLQALVVTSSAKRVTVLLDILGRPTAVQVQHHQLEPA